MLPKGTVAVGRKLYQLLYRKNLAIMMLNPYLKYVELYLQL